MTPIYCSETREVIPAEFFAQGKAVFCGGKPYLLEAAQRLGLAADEAVPAEFSHFLATPPPRVLTATPTPLPRNRTRKIYCTDTFEHIPLEYFSSGRAVWCGGKPYLLAAATRKGLAIDAAAPPGFHALRAAALESAPTPPPLPFRPGGGTPTPSSRQRQTSIGLVIGQKLFGRYDVKKVLGKGAMGEVLHVTDQQSHMDYALKRLPENMSPEKREAVRRNFHLTSQLTHPHIATTRNLEIDPKTGNIFVLMDLVRGQDMSKWLENERQKRGSHSAPLPIELSIGIAEQIASALDYAHSQPVSFDDDGNPTKFGVLHRDLKPANVMIETTRQYRPGVPYARIVDFGLATESQGALDDISQPQRNKKAGTPAYMAPEQWEGRTLTRGVDQWALAVIVYEMIAGERPFWDSTEFLLAQKIMGANPPKPAVLSDAQFAVLRKTFNVHRRERHHSCLALIKALAAADAATKSLVLAAEFPMPEDFLTQGDDE